MTTHRANCERLAAYLDALPDGMYDHDKMELTNRCGCAYAHAVGSQQIDDELYGTGPEDAAFGPGIWNAVFGPMAPWVTPENRHNQHAAAAALRAYAETLPEDDEGSGT